MSIAVYRFLIFWPQGDMEEYAGVKLPDPASYPVGTWAYDKANAINGAGWMQLVQYTQPRKVAWEAYSADAPDLIHITKHMKMMVLVMP